MNRGESGRANALVVPRTQANPEIHSIASSKEHDAPIFLAQFLIIF
jgi:hypothetical protein